MMTIQGLDRATAERIIEQLRFGVPPPQHVREFTVGREAQLRELEESLRSASDGRGSALLVRANYGAGKSHLLEVVREMALEAGYAVARVVVNAQEGVRFNRMDTILGAVSRELEVGGRPKGIGALFEAFAQTPGATLPKVVRETRDLISNGGKWAYSDRVKSSAVYVALRAWVASEQDSVRDLISDWFANPANYRGQRKLLHGRLVEDLRGSFRDPRPEWLYYKEEVFAFHSAGHRQAWDAIADFDLLARASGLRGLVLLFDEFEDVIQNLNRRDYQEQAFLNLFRFFAGDRFPGMSYFAVTPEFVTKCKSELLGRGVYDFDYKQFERLPFFELAPIEKREFCVLAKRICSVYAAAYGSDGEGALRDNELEQVVDRLWAVASPERVRRSIQGVVLALDRQLQGSH